MTTICVHGIGYVSLVMSLLDFTRRGPNKFMEICHSQKVEFSSKIKTSFCVTIPLTNDANMFLHDKIFKKKHKTEGIAL